MTITHKVGVIQKDSALGLFVEIYIVYTFWFQYGLFEISGLLSLLGIIILVLCLTEIKKITRYKLLLPIVIFFMYLFVISLFNNISMHYCIVIWKYFIPCLGVFSYASKSEKHFRKILLTICVSCFLLAIFLILKGQVNFEGAYQLSNLNTNQASNFFTIGFFATIFLIDLKKIKSIRNIFYVIISFMLCVAQIMCASRRGFIIMLFLIGAYIFCVMKVVLKKNYSMKILAIIIVCVAIVFLFSTYGHVFMHSAVAKRLSGENTTGDIARARYQAIAWELFKKKPIVGNGLGAVEHIAGAYSHSLYYEILSCTGILGTVILLSYFGVIIKKISYIGKKIYEKDNIYSFQASIIISFVISFLISGIAMVFIYESYFYIVIAVLCSFIYVYNKKLYSNN